MTVTTSPTSGGNAVDKGGNAQAPVAQELVSITIDGLPVSVPAITVNRVCGSGAQAIASAVPRIIRIAPLSAAVSTSML